MYLCCNPIYRKEFVIFSHRRGGEKQDKKNWPVISIDTLNSNEVRYHDTPKAREELSKLLGITNLKPSRNFTKYYITGSISKGGKTSIFLRRFRLMWLHEYKKIGS